MKRDTIKIPANQDEIYLYCLLGEALLKTQLLEQALSHSITLKMNPEETKEQADKYLKQTQRYTLGKAIKIAADEELFNSTIQKKLGAFLQERNWLIHNVIPGNEEDFNAGKFKEELLIKIKSISDQAENISRIIENDMIEFSASKGKNISKIIEMLKLQDSGIRIRK